MELLFEPDVQTVKDQMIGSRNILRADIRWPEFFLYVCQVLSPWQGVLNMENGHLHYCNAGHNPPVIGGGENKGDFLEMESIKGRALFIYTDGLNEAEDGEQRQFGEDQLLEILRDTHFDSARQVVETLTQKVEEHRAGAEPNDDLTMLCLRVS